MPAPEILLALLMWASNISGIPIPQNRSPLPIEIVSKEEIDPFNMKWGASTDKYTGKIKFGENWIDHGVDTYCMIAHEYTHWLQWANGSLTIASSSTEVEPIAYKVTGVCFEYYGDFESAKWAYGKSKSCMEKFC